MAPAFALPPALTLVMDIDLADLCIELRISLERGETYPSWHCLLERRDGEVDLLFL